MTMSLILLFFFFEGFPYCLILLNLVFRHFILFDFVLYVTLSHRILFDIVCSLSEVILLMSDDKVKSKVKTMRKQVRNGKTQIRQNN